jgi:hypothetical protein
LHCGFEEVFEVTTPVLLAKARFLLLDASILDLYVPSVPLNVEVAVELSQRMQSAKPSEH